MGWAVSSGSARKVLQEEIFLRIRMHGGRISAVIRDLKHQKRGMPPTVIVRREVLGKTWVTCPTIDVKLNYAARMTWPCSQNVKKGGFVHRTYHFFHFFFHDGYPQTGWGDVAFAFCLLWQPMACARLSFPVHVRDILRFWCLRSLSGRFRKDDAVTTALADLETGLTNDRVANWPPEVSFSPFRRFRVIIGC